MTEAFVVNGAAPRSRPAAAGPRSGDTPNLRLITDSDPETCIAAPRDTRSGRPGASVRAGKLQSALRTAITDGERWAALRAYFTPPALLTDSPASLPELREYAYTAPWTQQPYVARPYTDEDSKAVVKTGAVRRTGIWYFRGFVYPYTVWSRTKEWAVQRPGRLVLTLAVVKLIASTSYGSWAVDHLLYPTARVVGDILL